MLQVHVSAATTAATTVKTVVTGLAVLVQTDTGTPYQQQMPLMKTVVMWLVAMAAAAAAAVYLVLLRSGSGAKLEELQQWTATYQCGMNR